MRATTKNQKAWQRETVLSSGGGIPHTRLKIAKPTRASWCPGGKKKIKQQKNNETTTTKEKKKPKQNKTKLPNMKEHIMKKVGSCLWQWTRSLVLLKASSWTWQVWYRRDTAPKTESRLAYFKYALLRLQALPSQTLSAGSLDPQKGGEDEDVPAKNSRRLLNSTFFSL